MNEIMKCDRNGNLTEPIEKIECHEKGILHKAFSVYIIDKDKMLLQKRAEGKYHSAGLWSNACCSHFIPTKIETEKLIKEKFKQELGANCKNLIKIFDFRYKTKFENGLIENEHDSVYLAELDGELKINKEEVTQVKWIKIIDLIKDIKLNPQNYTYWFKKSYKRIIKHCVKCVAFNKCYFKNEKNNKPENFDTTKILKIKM